MRFILRNDLLAFDERYATWGTSWGDADGDGDIDLWLGHHGMPSNVLVNRLDEPVGTFVAVEAPGFNDKHGAVWADLDADGDRDMLVLRGGGKGGLIPKDMETLGNQLLINETPPDGDPVLVWPDDGLEETDSRGLYYSLGRGRTPTVLDIDLDGRLDVIVANDARPDGAFPTVAFLQQEDGTFLADPAALGVDANGVSLAMPADFDGDGLVDLYLRNEENESTIVYGTGTGFRPGADPLPAGLRDSRHLAADVVVADFNNDGTSDIWLATYRLGGFDSLFLNLGGRFVDVSAAAGLRAQGFMTRGAAMGDFDNDGDIDVYAVNGDYGALTVGGNRPNVVWENTGIADTRIQGETVRVPLFVPRVGPDYAPSDDNGLGYTVAVGEVNGDGALDLLVGNGMRVELTGTETMTRGTYDLFLGEADPANDWLMVSLVGTVSNIHGIGATVHATAGGLRQMRFADNGVHDNTQNDPRLHFGFGDLAPQQPVTLEIRWTSGATQRLEGVLPNQVLTVVEGQGQSGADSLRGTAAPEDMGGGMGADTLLGLGGDDAILGGLQNDRIEGGDGRDRLFGEGGNDTLLGGAQADRMEGAAGNDHLLGEDGNDTLLGGGGRDRLEGGEGGDLIRAEAGNDTVFGGAQADWIEGGDGNDLLDGEVGDDSLAGGNGQDTISGGNERDLLDGGTGRDRLDGGAGADTLLGGAGDDLMTGGTGADLFDVTTASNDSDTITDFLIGTDLIRLAPGTTVLVQADPAGALLALGTGGTILLAGLAPEAVQANLDAILA